MKKELKITLIVLAICLLIVGIIGGIIVGLNHNRFDKSNPIIFQSGDNGEYRYIIYEGREYVPYCAISPKDRKQYLGYVDNNEQGEVYTYKDYSKDEWLIEYLNSIMSDCMLYKEKNVTDIPNGLSSEYDWNN